MVKIIKLNQDLIKATMEEILAQGGTDVSSLTVVTPSQRMCFFIRDGLNRHFKGSYFPPEMMTIDRFVFTLFELSNPGFRLADEMDAALAIYRAVDRIYGNDIYTGGGSSKNFPDFFPWTLIILRAVEELLIEGEFSDQINQDIFEQFINLGDYHQGYKDFIAGLPQVVDQFQEQLMAGRRYSRGIAYRSVARLADGDDWQLPAGKKIIFSGLGALNASEEKIIGRFVKEKWVSLLVRCDPQALEDQNSPFSIVGDMFSDLNLNVDGGGSGSPEWNRFSGRVSLYSLPNMESQMARVVDIMKTSMIAGKSPDDLMRIAVVLPDSASLIPFIHGVVSRVSQQDEPIPFNISLGYPFKRTPLFQLLMTMIRVLDSGKNGHRVYAPDYLSLIRHPYVKLSASGEGEQESLKRGIHLIEDLISRENLFYFNPDQIMERIRSLMEVSDEFTAKTREEIIGEVRKLHATFLAGDIDSLAGLAEFLKQAVLTVGRFSKHHLFLENYVNTAANTLDRIIRFARNHEDVTGRSDFRSLASLLTHYFTGIQIYFEGSPLKGIQVMGMLETRGLSFDEVIVIDAAEGILPKSQKYDPLLPLDIRKVFGVRSYSDWEKLYAFNFFSLIGSAKRAHILWVDGQDKGSPAEKSRFVERIAFEIEKEQRKPPEVVRNRFSSEPFSKYLKRVEKNEAIRDRIGEMTFTVSALENYIRCPLRFYFSHVVGLEERRELSLDPDMGDLGNLVHRILEGMYRKGGLDLDPVRLERQLAALTRQAFGERGFNIDSGIGKIRYWVVNEKLRDFLVDDLARLRNNGIRVTGFEKGMAVDLDLPFGSLPIRIKGRIDRLEQEGNLIRLIDYKTGTPFLTGLRERSFDISLAGLKHLPECEWLSALEEFHKSCQSFQLFLYAMMMNHPSDNYSDLDAAYIFLKPANDFFRPVFGRGSRMDSITIEEKNGLMKNFSHNLVEILEDIFYRGVFAGNTGNLHYCGHCPFRLPCGNI